MHPLLEVSEIHGITNCQTQPTKLSNYRYLTTVTTNDLDSFILYELDVAVGFIFTHEEGKNEQKMLLYSCLPFGLYL